MLAVNPQEVGLLEQPHMQLDGYRQEDRFGDRSGRQPRVA